MLEQDPSGPRNLLCGNSLSILTSTRSKAPRVPLSGALTKTVNARCQQLTVPLRRCAGEYGPASFTTPCSRALLDEIQTRRNRIRDGCRAAEIDGSATVAAERPQAGHAAAERVGANVIHQARGSRRRIAGVGRGLHVPVVRIRSEE